MPCSKLKSQRFCLNLLLLWGSMENKFKCTYPGCKKKGCYSQSFEVLNEKGVLVELLFCQYHSFVVMGGHFKAKKIGKDFELTGPLKEVEIVEQVMGARELTTKLQNDNKDLKEEKS